MLNVEHSQWGYFSLKLYLLQAKLAVNHNEAGEKMHQRVKIALSSKYTQLRRILGLLMTVV